MKNLIRNTLDRSLHRPYEWPSEQSPLIEPHMRKTKKEIATDMMYGGLSIVVGATAILALNIHTDGQSESAKNTDHEWSVPLVD